MIAEQKDRIWYIFGLPNQPGHEVKRYEFTVGPLDDLEEWGRQLKIRFDRPIIESQSDASGINNFTFIVQYGGIQEDLEFMPGKAELSDDGLVAIFTLFKPEEEQSQMKNLTMS